MNSYPKYNSSIEVSLTFEGEEYEPECTATSRRHSPIRSYGECPGSQRSDWVGSSSRNQGATDGRSFPWPQHSHAHCARRWHLPLPRRKSGQRLRFLLRLNQDQRPIFSPSFRRNFPVVFLQRFNGSVIAEIPGFPDAQLLNISLNAHIWLSWIITRLPLP